MLVYCLAYFYFDDGGGDDSDKVTSRGGEEKQEREARGGRGERGGRDGRVFLFTSQNFRIFRPRLLINILWPLHVYKETNIGCKQFLFLF